MSLRGETGIGLHWSWSRLGASCLDGTAKKDTPKGWVPEMHVQAGPWYIRSKAFCVV